MAFFVVLSVDAKDKSDGLKPSWISSVPQSDNSSYSFVSTSGTGTSLESARRSAFYELINRIEVERGISTSAKTSYKQLNNWNSQGEDNINETETYEIEYRIDGKEFYLTSRVIDEYWEFDRGNFTVVSLFAVSQNGVSEASVDNIYTTDKYGFTPMFMSIIPGIGQWYKGSKIKGSVMFLAEAAAITALIICENNRSAYVKKSIEQPKFYNIYSNRADNWKTGRNICVGVAAGIWVWNIFDAAFAKGARHVVIDKSKNIQLSYNPYTDFKSAGINLSLNF